MDFEHSPRTRELLGSWVSLSGSSFNCAGGPTPWNTWMSVEETVNDIIYQIGALLTLRDTESVRRIEDEIEMSRRLSASGRLTRGVAHEVKNPINAIVLHLQLLQNKLKEVDPDTRRHMDIIDSEIHRLDRVVQILVDFTRPRDLHVEEMDFRRLLEDVVMLASPDAAQHGVTIRKELPDQPLGVMVDTDFM